MRADLGNATDFWQAQTFDGPGPETINSRLSMVSRDSLFIQKPMYSKAHPRV
jgi:hypothetical protein